ncbi:UPF0481 protein [Spatholobus suberectus]|nr:UPF0481 protein [Spatholobus suberectus]
MERSDHSWIVSMQVMLGSLHHHQVQTCSISSVRDELRNPNEAAFKPKEVSVGPLHRGTTRRVRLMEETKWHFMSEFLDGAGTGIENQNKLLGECCIEILELDKIISASYGGNIESEPHELAKMMIVDGCFLLELLIRLGRYMESQDDDTSSRSYYDDPLLKSKKKIVSILNDITMLENQIPFIVLKKLYRTVFPNGSDIFNDHRVDHIVWKAFRYPVEAFAEILKRISKIQKTINGYSYVILRDRRQCFHVGCGFAAVD